MMDEVKSTIKKAIIYGTVFFVFFIIGVGLADSNLEAHTKNVFSANVPTKITVRTITPTPIPELILPLNGGFVFEIAPELKSEPTIEPTSIPIPTPILLKKVKKSKASTPTTAVTPIPKVDATPKPTITSAPVLTPIPKKIISTPKVITPTLTPTSTPEVSATTTETPAPTPTMTPALPPSKI